MIVMKYYENGNLYQYLDHCNGILSWRDMIDMLWGIAGDLERIHTEGKIHGNLHGGNLLIEDEKVSTDARIGDVGLHGPCNYDENERSNQTYGVLPYTAPEVLRGCYEYCHGGHMTDDQCFKCATYQTNRIYHICLINSIC
jgi:serine/threonine protein kinase